jgi:hypothetical protein
MVTLGLSPPYVLEDVKAAYRDRARETHPDRGGSLEAFNAVQEAFERAQEYVAYRGDRRGWIAAKMARYKAMQDAVDRLRALGAEVTVYMPPWLENSYGDFAQLTETVQSVRLEGPADGDALIASLVADHEHLRELAVLELPGCTIADHSVIQLAYFQQLRRLDLSNTPVTAGVLDLIDAIPALREMELEGTQVGWWAKRRADAKLQSRASEL